MRWCDYLYSDAGRKLTSFGTEGITWIADENGDLKAEYAQNDGYHIKPEGYTVWVDYLQTHTVNSGVAV